MPKRIVARESWIAQDFVPETFGRLTTISSPYRPDHCNRTVQDFCCSCGATGLVLVRANVKGGNTNSCGCLQREKASIVGRSQTTHGHFKNGKSSHEYKSYEAMIARCYNKDSEQYPRYGGRGIKVYPDWLGPGGFERWLAHIGPRPSGTTQDRFPNNDGNYEPGNVRWATKEEQENNKSTNKHIEYINKNRPWPNGAES